MLILKELKVLCFHTLLQVLILKGLILSKNQARCIAFREGRKQSTMASWLAAESKNASRDAGVTRDGKRNCIRDLYYASSNGLSRKKGGSELGCRLAMNLSALSLVFLLPSASPRKPSGA